MFPLMTFAHRSTFTVVLKDGREVTFTVVRTQEGRPLWIDSNDYTVWSPDEVWPAVARLKGTGEPV